MGKAGSDQFGKWNENKRDWDTVTDNDKIKTQLTGANKFSKVDIKTELQGIKNSIGEKLFNDKDLDAYKDFDAYKSGDKLFINRKGESDFHELNGEKKWDKVTDPSVKANLSAAANPELKTSTENKDAVAIKTEEVKEAETKKTETTEEAKAVEQHKAADSGLGTLAGSLATTALGGIGGLVSSLAPESSKVKDLIEKGVTNYIEDKAWNSFVDGKPQDAIKTMEHGLDLKEKSFDESVTKGDIKKLAENRLTLDFMKEQFQTPLTGKDLSATYPSSRIATMHDLKSAFPEGRVEQLKEAMTTGMFNGKAISQEEAKGLYQDGLIYQNLVAGKFNTADGQFSIGALDLANTIHAGGRTNERMQRLLAQ